MHENVSSEKQEPQGLRSSEPSPEGQSREAVTGLKSSLMLWGRSLGRCSVWAPVLPGGRD